MQTDRSDDLWVLYMKKIYGRMHQFSRDNFFMKIYCAHQRKKKLNKEFLKSPEYPSLFYRHIDDEFNFLDFLDDAETKSKNYRYRHGLLGYILGSWRWKGVFEFREQLMEYIFEPSLRGLDLGGAFGPISAEIDIVDFNPKDVFGHEVRFRTIKDVTFSPDFLFSSHTLEHIPQLERTLEDLSKLLKKEAKLFFNLPSYTCKRWRSGIHSNRKFNDHVWTFYLEPDQADVENLQLTRTMAIDQVISKYFKLEEAKYTGDNSIFIIAQN